jgi:hypothetical protein
VKEETLTADRKLVIVVDRDLAPGFAANTTAVLALTVGAKHPELIGADLIDASGQEHLGITTLPIPVLAATQDAMREAMKLASGYEIEIVSFTSLAQGIHTYEEYATAIKAAPSESLSFTGIAFYGAKKSINSITGSLPRFG